MTKLRVLHFLWSGNIGGAERALYQMVREETARGEWEVGVAFGCAEGPYFEAVKSLGCEVHDLNMRNGADVLRARWAAAALRPYDIHHFHVLEPSLMLASTKCDGAVRVFTQRHGSRQEPVPVRKRIRQAFAGRLLRKHFHAVGGNTLHAARWAVSAYRLEHLPYEVTPNGIDFSLLAPSRDRGEVRRELGAGPETILVGSSGTFKGWKRLSRVVDLLDAPLDLRVLLVGDGASRAALEAQADALGARDRLHITGLVRNVADYLEAMDIFVLPSSAEESFGNSVVEAMALGLPSIIFSDSPGICEHMGDGESGFIVRDQAELVSVVQRLCTDPGLRARIGSTGASHVRSKYTLENMHVSYRRLYDLALAHSMQQDAKRHI